MVEVEIIRSIWHEGRPVKVGAVIDLDAPTAAYVVGIRRAAYVVDAPSRAESGKVKSAKVNSTEAGPTEAGSAKPAADEPPEQKPQRRRSGKGAA